MDETNNRVIPMIHPALRRPGFGMPATAPEQEQENKGSPVDPTPDMVAADRQQGGIEPWFRTPHGGGGPR